MIVLFFGHMHATQTTPQATNLLAPSLKMGAVSLNVRDMALMQGFYTRVIGLNILKKEDQKSILGYNNMPIVILHEMPDLPIAPLHSAGLYHLAIVFSSRGNLARTLQRVLADVPDFYTGSGDHLVSESFYLSDPEGNGIELYFDKNPSTWEWENGFVKMATLYISEYDYVQQHSSIQDQGGMKIGHVHLKVGDIGEARRFYIDTVGFVITATMPSALFVSVGGYHHHLGMNTWESRSAGKREETIGLNSFELILPTSDDTVRLKERLLKNNVGHESSKASIIFADPWGNRMVVKTS